MGPLEMDLDILGQQPALSNLYTQLSFCYPLSDTHQRHQIVATLTKGLERLSSSLPWLAGQVVHEDLPSDARGIYKIRPLADTPRLVVKDLTQEPGFLTMDGLRQDNFPIRLLDESVVAPYKTLAAGSEEVAESSPVFAIQAIFIRGGLVLTFVTQHNVMDMTGQGQVTYLFSKACCNEPFTEEELRTGNLERLNLVPLLDQSYQPGPELDMQIIRPNPSASTPAGDSIPPPPTCSWAYFAFSAKSLAALKSQATHALSSGYVSTDDVLSAYIWRSILKARQHRLDPSTKTTFGRAVDPRRYLGIPKTYTGLLTNMVYQAYSIRELLVQPLGAIAASLRATVEPKSSQIGYNTRALTTHYLRAVDRSTIGVTVNINPAVDLTLSSWSKIDCYGLEFGLGLGKPECVRRPGFTPVESLLYLMPKAPNGEIAAALCLRDEDMQNLRADEDFAHYAAYIG